MAFELFAPFNTF